MVLLFLVIRDVKCSHYGLLYMGVKSCGRSEAFTSPPPAAFLQAKMLAYHSHIDADRSPRKRSSQAVSRVSLVS